MSTTTRGDFIFIYDPDRDLPPNRQHPFAAPVTGERHDTVADLERPDVFRLNIGVSRETFESLFPDGAADIDYTARDRVMPHPVYGRVHHTAMSTGPQVPPRCPRSARRRQARPAEGDDRGYDGRSTPVTG